jgi:hypothetical protein
MDTAATLRKSDLLTASLAYAAMAGAGCFVLAILALHVVQPELSPLNEAMSYYVHGANGWLATVALLAIGAGSLALTIGLGLQLDGREACIGFGFLAVWSIGAILGGAFAADPRGNWDKQPTMAGAIHGIAAMVALTAFPPAAALITRNIRRNAQIGRIGRLLSALAIASVISFVAFFGSLLPVFVRPGPPVLLGLTERILLAIYAAWLVTCALGLLQSRPGR